jgi:four helix bundle protein
MNEYGFRKLNVWQKSIDLVEYIYQNILPKYPKSEMFGIISQIGRSAVSIPSNIAEGTGRYSKKEFKQFLYNARGSLFELVTQFDISLKLGYITKSDYDELTKRTLEISGLLNGLINSLKQTIDTQPSGRKTLNIEH